MDAENVFVTKFEYSTTFTDVSAKEPGIYSSPEFELQNMPWAVNLDIKKIKGEKFVLIYLSCNYREPVNNWCCTVEGCIEIKGKEKKISKIFTAELPNAQYWMLYQPLDYLEKHGYVVNNELQVRLKIEVQIPQRCNFPKEIFYNYLKKAHDNWDKLCEENKTLKRTSEEKIESEMQENESLRADKSRLLAETTSFVNKMEQGMENFSAMITQLLKCYELQKATRIAHSVEVAGEEPPEILYLITELQNIVELMKKVDGTDDDE